MIVIVIFLNAIDRFFFSGQIGTYKRKFVMSIVSVNLHRRTRFSYITIP
jgi:hypothetical protein